MANPILQLRKQTQKWSVTHPHLPSVYVEAGRNSEPEEALPDRIPDQEL